MTATSAVKTTFVKRTGLAAACVLGIGGAALSAQQIAAQTPKPPFAQLRPGQSVEMIAPAAPTIVSTVHYQAMIGLECGASTGNINGCIGTFRSPHANQQFNITRIWCDIITNSGAINRFGVLDLVTRNGALLLEQGLPLGSSSPDGLYQVNRAVDLQVDYGRTMQALFLFSTVADSGVCTVAGTLSTLQ